VAREASERAERHHDDVGVVGALALDACLAVRDLFVLRLETLPERLGLDSLRALRHPDRVHVA
jgi:hypothetical protein